MPIWYCTPWSGNYYKEHRGLKEPRKPKNKTLLKKEEAKERESEITDPIW